jgi:large subunit ribosomal protein L18
MKKKVRNRTRAHWLGRRRRVGRSIERSDRARLSVFRSARHTYAQLIDPESGRTIASVSTLSPKVREGLGSSGNVEGARRVGQAIAEIAREKQIEEVVFHRNGFLYHGRVRAVADAAREAGLKF